MDTFSRVLGVFVHYTDEQVGQKAWQPHGLRLGGSSLSARATAALWLLLLPCGYECCSAKEWAL